MRVFYSPYYYADIGANHVFPIRKFELARDQLISEGTLKPAEVVEPRPLTVDEALLVHTEDYIMRLRAGALTERELRRLGLPWSKSLVRRSFYASGGTLCAALYSLYGKAATNLAGGTHHSFPDRGEGFCVLNDVAITIRVLMRDNLISRAAVIDCDVHQGNGTAAIFADDQRVFTFSMHGAKNYPLFKERSRLDIELPDKTGDEEYLATLAGSLPEIFAFSPEIVFYLAGADPYRGDRLGRLSLTIEGLRERDSLVIGECFTRQIPLVTVMSGGYASDIKETVEIHCNTIRTLAELFRRGASSDVSGRERQLVGL